LVPEGNENCQEVKRKAKLFFALESCLFFQNNQKVKFFGRKIF